MSENSTLGQQQSTQEKFKQVCRYLLTYLKNPVHSIRKIPDWDWPTVLLVHTSIAAASGILGGIVSRRISQILSGLIVWPISATVTGLVVAGFFYYTFMFFLKREVPYKRIFTVIVLASIPMMFLSTVSTYLPPINLLGLAVTGFLLIVGFVDNFQLNRKKVIQLIASIFVIYALLWIGSRIELTKDQKLFRNKATPESLDILERELKGS